MLTAEETQVLYYLRRRPLGAVTELARSCLAGASPEWVGRVVARLDWFGYVVAFYGPGGSLAALQITERGLSHAGG
jgi:hypothetical protein